MRQQGFTLVELAISLMIIGLLIGGVLKGQELIANAEITKLAKQIESYQSAVQTFYTQFGSLPGDIKNPSKRIPGCTTAPCSTPGDDDELIYSNYWGTIAFGNNISATTVMGTYESRNFFFHLAKTGMIGGVNPNSTTSAFTEWGQELPAAPQDDTGIGIYYVSAAAYGDPTPGNFFFVNKTDWNQSAMTAESAAGIDQKMDNGRGTTGSVRAVGNALTGPPTGSGCTDVNGVYAEATSGKLCNVMVRLQAGKI